MIGKDTPTLTQRLQGFEGGDIHGFETEHEPYPGKGIARLLVIEMVD
jgi:hypothetical protein